MTKCHDPTDPTMRSVICNTDTGRWSWVPFSIPANRHGVQHRFSGPWIVASILDQEIWTYHIDLKDGVESTFRCFIHLSAIQNRLGVPIKSFDYNVAHNGMMSVAVVTSSTPMTCVVFTGDLRTWNEEAFLDSGVSFEVGVAKINSILLDTRYTIIRISNVVLILDHISRKFQLVLRFNETMDYEVYPIDSTCMLVNTKSKVQLLDFGLHGIPGMPLPAPLASAMPSYAVVDLSSTAISIRMVNFNPKKAAEQLAGLTSNPKIAIDGVAHHADPWTITYVLHTNFKIKKSEHSKSLDQFVSILAKLEATQVNSDISGLKIEDAIDVLKTTSRSGTPSKGFISHSRSGQHTVDSAVTKTSLVVIRIATSRNGQRSVYRACHLTEEEARHALENLGF